MRIEEQPYDDRHNTPPRAGGYATMREAANAGRRKVESGPMDRLAEVPKADAWGKPWNPGELTTREYDIVLNPDEDLAVVMAEFTGAAEVEMTGLHPLMWRELESTNGWPRVQVMGELARVTAFENELNSQPAQKRLTRDGWIRRYLDDFRTDVEWLRVVWLPEGPAPKGCDMAGCETGVRQRWAIAYRVPCERGTVPMDRELFVYCESTVKADNDVATFIEEGK
jgi:hypothetical protein